MTGPLHPRLRFFYGPRMGVGVSGGLHAGYVPPLYQVPTWSGFWYMLLAVRKRPHGFDG